MLSIHVLDVCCREAGENSSKQHGQACSVAPYRKLDLLSPLSVYVNLPRTASYPHQIRARGIVVLRSRLAVQVVGLGRGFETPRSETPLVSLSIERNARSNRDEPNFFWAFSHHFAPLGVVSVCIPQTGHCSYRTKRTCSMMMRHSNGHYYNQSQRACIIMMRRSNPGLL
jgi:hypothetical protein